MDLADASSSDSTPDLQAQLLAAHVSQAALVVAHAALQAEHAALKEEAAQLAFWNQQLRRALFGPRSEKLHDTDQRDLFVEDVEQILGEAAARTDAAAAEVDAATGQDRPRRTPHRNIGALPADLPREVREILPASTNCPCCATPMHRIGEDVSEKLKVVPRRYVVERIVRPRFACRGCTDGVVQAPAPDNVITGGMVDVSVVAEVIVQKYAWHLPLYRQQQMLAGMNIHLDRSTLARWVGAAAHWLQPLGERLRTLVLDRDHLFCDETRLPILAPGSVRNGTMWAVASDDRPHGGTAPPAVVYRIGGRAIKDAREALGGFAGVLQVDGYASYKALAADPARSIELAFCFAHVRRKFYDIWEANKLAEARTALDKIGELYALEDQIRGKPPDFRKMIRQMHAAPVLDKLKAWAQTTLIALSGKSPLAAAIRYMLSHWDGLVLYCANGDVEIDSNTVERQIRPIAVGRKNHLFAGSQAGAQHWALFASLLNTAKLNSVDPQTWLSDVLERIVTGKAKINRLDDLMPWVWKAQNQSTASQAACN
jgi:transposase